MNGLPEGWKQTAETVKPAKEITQGVLWIKQMGLMSSHFETIREGKALVSEAFLNQMMQLAWDAGRKDIDDRSFRAGQNAANAELRALLKPAAEHLFDISTSDW